MKSKVKFFICLFLSMAFLFQATGCGEKEDVSYATYKTEICNYLDGFVNDESPEAFKITVLQVKNKINNTVWDGKKNLTENKAVIDNIINSATPILDAAFANVKDTSEYAPKGVIKSNALDGSKGDYALLVGELIEYLPEVKEKIESLSDQTLKNDLLAVKTTEEIYESSSVTFNATGKKAIITNSYTELGCKLISVLGREVDENGFEVLRGTYSLSSTPNKWSSDYNISVTFSGDSKATFVLNSESGNIYRNDIFNREKLKEMSVAEALKGAVSSLKDENGNKLTWTNDDGTVLKNVKYGNRERNVMDVYVPQNLDKTKDNGFIMFIHGGSWVSGDKEDLATWCVYYARKGYVTATMCHTFATTKLDESGMPIADQNSETYARLLTGDMINEEINEAFKKVKALSDENGWRLTQAATSGYSSGSHLSALYAYSYGNEADAPIPVKMNFSYVGTMDFRTPYWENVAVDGPGVAALLLNDYRLLRDDNPEQPENAYTDAEFNEKTYCISPTLHAENGDAVPTLLAYAELDELLVDPEQARGLTDALTSHNIENYCLYYPNSGHALCNNPAFNNVFMNKINQMLKKYLG